MGRALRLARLGLVTHSPLLCPISPTPARPHPPQCPVLPVPTTPTKWTVETEERYLCAHLHHSHSRCLPPPPLSSSFHTSWMRLIFFLNNKIFFNVLFGRVGSWSYVGTYLSGHGLRLVPDVGASRALKHGWLCPHLSS